MNDLNTHYRQLLGLGDDWKVVDVNLDLAASRVVIDLEHVGGKLCCPECSQPCVRADTAPKRTWRQLDTMQFATEIRAAVPRSQCARCVLKTIAVPWAGKRARFALLFEAFAIRVLQAASSVSRAASLLELSWGAAHAIIAAAVERGLDRRQTEYVQHVGVDKKSFGKGHDFVSVLTDIGQSRVLEVVRDRTIAACDQLWKTQTKQQLERVQSVSMDMWQAFMTSATKNVPGAKIVHDKFQIAKYLGETVDKVRRAEHRELKNEGDSPLTGLRQLFLYNEEHLDEDSYYEVLTIQRADLKTGRAWAIKENFRNFWTYRIRGWGRRFSARWYGWATRSQLPPIKKVAKMLQSHLNGLLNYFDHRVTNATSEGFNSRIQSIKSADRGFRNFENYRTRILFYCGKLDLMPNFTR